MLKGVDYVISNSFALQTINFVKLICLSVSKALSRFYISRRSWKSCRTAKNLPWREDKAGDSQNSTLSDRKYILGP